MSYIIREASRSVEDAVAPELPGGGTERWLARLIAKRVDDVSLLEGYMNYGLDSLPNPLQMLNMREAASHLAQVIRGNDCLYMVADFDADGITCKVVADLAFRQFGYSNYKIVIPDRIRENHGLNKRHVDEAAVFGARTIVTMDNGSSCGDAIAYAKIKGICTIVTDHHEVPDPDMDVFLMVNPQNPKDMLGDKDFCGAGITFLLMQAIAMELGISLDIRALLQACAISTMADVVPLTSNNRKLVRTGIGLMRTEPIPFIEAACQIHGIDHRCITATDLSWRIAPMLNATSRIERAEYAVQAMMADGDRAYRGANYLYECNKRRALMLDDVLNDFIPKYACIHERVSVYCDEGWHLGLVGLMAGKIAREEGKVVGCGAPDQDGNWRISFRSHGEGADIAGALQLAVKNGTALGGGGHDGAGGATLRLDTLEEFAQFVEKGLGTVQHVRVVDGEVSPSWWTIEKIEDANAFMQPFGRSNPPLSMVWTGRIESVNVLKGKHLKIHVDGVDGIAFGMGHLADAVKRHSVRLFYEPSINEWKGLSSVQIMVTEMEIMDG